MFEANFDWFQVGNYKWTTKRIEDGHRLCDDFMKLVQDRAEIEKNYAKSLKDWSKKWQSHIVKGLLRTFSLNSLESRVQWSLLPNFFFICGTLLLYWTNHHFLDPNEGCDSRMSSVYVNFEVNWKINGNCKFLTVRDHCFWVIIRLNI